MIHLRLVPLRQNLTVVTAKTQYNLAKAKEYFEERLCVGDYYDEGQRVSGEWQGIGAARLGLADKVRYAATGATGKLSGILNPGLLVEVSGRFVTVPKKMLDRISVCQLREVPITSGDRLHLKSNRNLETRVGDVGSHGWRH